MTGVGSITGYIDVPQLVLYAFWIFFAALIYYLRQEDKREGYPLEVVVVIEGWSKVRDASGEIQLFVSEAVLGAEQHEEFASLIDRGDWVGVEGRVFRTRTNELTVWASRIHFLAKCLLPLPEKFHGLTDVETRYRQRYLDLISNTDVRKTSPETRGASHAGSWAYHPPQGGHWDEALEPGGRVSKAPRPWGAAG